MLDDIICEFLKITLHIKELVMFLITRNVGLLFLSEAPLVGQINAKIFVKQKSSVLLHTCWYVVLHVFRLEISVKIKSTSGPCVPQ
jgi:hypothetical protein